MSLLDFAVTLQELNGSIKNFIEAQCERTGDHYSHKSCGGGIRLGFLPLFYLNDDGSLDPGDDGFGIGPKRVPYCEKCFPPDGFNQAYAVRFPILRERKKTPKGFEFYWGNREIIRGSERPLLE